LSLCIPVSLLVFTVCAIARSDAQRKYVPCHIYCEQNRRNINSKGVTLEHVSPKQNSETPFSLQCMRLLDVTCGLRGQLTSLFDLHAWHFAVCIRKPV
jgi:hypothetical protein